MQITKSAKRNKNLSSPKTSDYLSPNESVSIQNNNTIHTEIIPISKSVLMNLTQKPIKLNQDQSASESQPECYFTSLQSQEGYLNITDRQTYRISKYETNIKKYPVSLNKSKQISQYIIINNKTVQNNRRQSKSVNEQMMSLPNTTNSSSGSNIILHRINKRSKARRNISLALKMVYQKAISMKESVTVTRAKRTDKGGVVDLALPDIDKTFCLIQYNSKKILNSPKKREMAAIVIQRWWRRILILFKGIDCKIVLLQSIFRGYIVRKVFYSTYCLENERRKRLVNKYGLFVLFTVKAVQLKIEFSKHHLLHILADNKIKCIERDVNYQTAISVMSSFRKRMHYREIINLFKQKRFCEIIHQLQLLKTTRYISRWQNTTIKLEPLKQERLKRVVDQRNLINNQKTMLFFCKTYMKWKNRTKNILSNEKRISNNKTKERNDSIKISQEKDQLKGKLKKILFESVSSLNLKNSLLKKSYFYKWRRKTTTQNKRQKIKGKGKLPHYLLENICRSIINRIKRESNRRKLIKMFLHIRNLQTPTLGHAMQKIIFFSNIQTQIFNAYASYIQSYFRMKKSQKPVLIQMTTKQTSFSKKQTTIEDSDVFQSHNNIQATNVIMPIQNARIDTIQLEPTETFAYLTRRLFIKAIVYTLMVAC